MNIKRFFRASCLEIQGDSFICPTFVLAITFYPLVQSQQIFFYLIEEMLGNRFILKFNKNGVVLTRKLNFRKSNGKIRFFVQLSLFVVSKCPIRLKKKLNLCCG
jgi:hypothetical protein